jgi:hypothetical protein
MEFFKNLDKKHIKALKIAGLVVLGIIALAVISGAFEAPRIRIYRGGVGMGLPSVAPAMDYGYGGGVKEEGFFTQKVGGDVMFSTRNAMPYPQYGGSPSGDMAEAFEVTDYNATIESSDSEETCAKVLALKSKSYVIFENSNSYDRGCNHTFKVKKANVDEILAAIKALDPKDISENTRTIKAQVDDYTNEIEILKKKLDTIDATLRSAISAYDGITAVATRNQDAASLATIISSKLSIIERLTQEKIDVSMQLDRYARAKAQEVDKLEYTYFNVAVYENKYVDGRGIGESWKAAVRQFVYDVNRIIQDLTIGIIGFVLVLAQILLYVFIVVFVAKFAWKGVKGIWNK